MISNPMSNSWVSWVRMFDIPDVSKHKDGFTIYKVISFLYPESCPDAVTKLIVWKRYNDFKKLHKEIKLLHKNLNMKDVLPILPKSVLFKRHDEETINQRKRGILNFLEYIGTHAVLFTSTVFVKFFEVSHTPAKLLNSNINAIRADLNLPEETDLCYNRSDDERTVSDTDSFTSSNLGSTAQAIDLMSDSISKTSITNLRKLNSMTSIDSQSSKTSDTFSISNVDHSLLLLEDQYSPTSASSVSLHDITQYLMNASIHINMAIELENDKQFDEAFSAYKTAVDILISGGKDDPDFDRRQMVRYKTEKYLIRAEKIYNMYLAPEIKDLHLQKREEIEKPNIVKGPLYNLYKYKVIKIISPSGMLVLHSENQQIYYIKVIHKTVQFVNNQLILPEHVPYMVKLVNHYNSENALFLVLEYCSGTKLRDILQNKSANSMDQSDQLLRKIEDQFDNESEASFSELLSDYASGRQTTTSDSTNEPRRDVDSDDSFEKVEISDAMLSNAKNIVDQPLDDIGACDLLTTLSRGKSTSGYEDAVSLKKHCDDRPTLSSDVSSFESSDEFDSRQSNVSEEHVVKWASELLVALEKLHSLGVVCRDLKIDNLLIDENNHLVLTYMCNIKELCDLYSRGVNTDLAPEVYSFEEITDAVDWWSFGAILYELLVGMPLSKVHTSGITSYTHLSIPKYVSTEGKSLLKQLLIYEPQERLGTRSNGIQHLKSHPFFRSVPWCTVETRAS